MKIIILFVLILGTLAGCSAPKNDLYGFLETERKEYYIETIKAEEKAREIADERYEIPKEYAANKESEIRILIEKNQNLRNELNNQYKKEIQEKRNINDEIDMMIFEEGFKKGW